LVIEEVLFDIAVVPGRGKALLPLVGIARREAGLTGTPDVFVFLAESTKFSLSAKESFIFLLEGVVAILLLVKIKPIELNQKRRPIEAYTHSQEYTKNKWSQLNNDQPFTLWSPRC
jgi:hypothetical protein